MFLDLTPKKIVFASIQMDKSHVEILRKNRVILRQQLKAERIATRLYAVGILDQEDLNEIEACSTPERKTEALLDLLLKSGPDAFPRLYEVLKKTQHHLADVLMVPLSEEISEEMAGVNLEGARLRDQHVNFVGREDLCRNVVSHVNTECRLVVLSGPPGYGKSEASITIGHQLKNHGFVILYFSLKEVTDLYDASIFILETLGIVPSTRPVSQMEQFLKSLPRKTVLILDNTENVQQKENVKFLEFLKKIGEFPNGLCTVVTTTEVFRQPMCHPFSTEAIPLEPLRNDESMLLLKRYVRDKYIPRAQAVQLCKACMGIPLFLEIAASQVRNGADTLSLIQDLQSNPQQLLKEDGMYFRCMKVFLSRLPGDLKAVLAYLAVFPVSFTYEETRSFFLSENHAVGRLNIDSLQSHISQLMSYALLKYNGETNTYQLHNVVKSVCKSNMDDVVFASYSRAVYTFIRWRLNFLQEINVLFITPDGKRALDQYSRNKRNIMHALILAIEHDYEPAIDVSTQVLNLLAKCLNIKEFLKVYWGFAAIAEAKKDKKRYSDCLTSLGFKLLCFHGKANSDKAFDLLFDANRLQREHQLPESEETAHCMSKLGVCYARQGNVERGVRMIACGLGMRKRLHARLGGDIREMLVYGGYCDLAMALYTINEFKAAVKIWETICLVGYRRIMKKHPFTASLLQYIGDAYHKLRDYQKAADYKQQALDMRKHLLTTYHQDTARSYSSLAETLEKIGKPLQAVEMLQHTLRIQSRVWASPEDISATEREIKRLQSTDDCRMMGRCSTTSLSKVSDMLLPL